MDICAINICAFSPIFCIFSMMLDLRNEQQTATYICQNVPTFITNIPPQFRLVCRSLRISYIYIKILEITNKIQTKESNSNSRKVINETC